MTRREDCPICGGDIYLDYARGVAKNTKTGFKVMVCVDCDGSTYTPEDTEQ